MSDVTRARLSGHTTLRLGGPAGGFVDAVDQGEIVERVRATADPVLILAGGSNVVVSDDGFPGTVIHLATRGIGVRRDAGGAHVTVEAGHPWDEVVEFAVAEGLAGIECLAGIPGSAGATPIQNVGAYGQEVAETIDEVRVYDRQTSEIRRLTPDECDFAYRTSRFKHASRWIVLSVTFRLRPSNVSDPLRYAELARSLDIAPGGRAPLTRVREAVLELRRSKAMVLDSDDPDTYSVGSFFTNPVLDAATWADLHEKALGLTGSEPMAWPDRNGAVKVSAAWLIERAGFRRGYDGGHPGVAISSRHTLALTNRGSGSTSALLALARDIRDGVRKTFDLELRVEPVLVNCEL